MPPRRHCREKSSGRIATRRTGLRQWNHEGCLGTLPHAIQVSVCSYVGVDSLSLVLCRSLHRTFERVRLDLNLYDLRHHHRHHIDHHLPDDSPRAPPSCPISASATCWLLPKIPVVSPDRLPSVVACGGGREGIRVLTDRVLEWLISDTLPNDSLIAAVHSRLCLLPPQSAQLLLRSMESMEEEKDNKKKERTTAASSRGSSSFLVCVPGAYQCTVASSFESGPRSPSMLTFLPLTGGTCKTRAAAVITDPLDSALARGTCLCIVTARSHECFFLGPSITGFSRAQTLLPLWDGPLLQCDATSPSSSSLSVPGRSAFGGNRVGDHSVAVPVLSTFAASVLGEKRTFSLSEVIRRHRATVRPCIVGCGGRVPHATTTCCAEKADKEEKSWFQTAPCTAGTQCDTRTQFQLQKRIATSLLWHLSRFPHVPNWQTVMMA